MPRALTITKLLEDTLLTGQTEETMKRLGAIIKDIQDDWNFLAGKILQDAPTSYDPEEQIAEYKKTTKPKLDSFAKKIGSSPRDDLFWIALSFVCNDENYHAYDEVEDGKFKGMEWDEALAKLTGQARRVFLGFRTPDDFIQAGE